MGIVTADPDGIPPAGTARPAAASTTPRLSVEELGFSVMVKGVPRRILDRVSFEVARGTLFTVLGPSGSGKSTLLRCIDRLIEPDAGRVLLDGRPASELPVQELRRRVGMVFQTAALFEGTVLDNVMYGPRLHTAGRGGPEGCVGRPPRSGEEDGAAALLARVGLPTSFLSRPTGDLSGGEAQRVSIARALANDPDVLLLDEPTSALDPTASQLIQDLLLSLADEGDLTFVFVTHDLRQARRIGDRGLLLVDGRVVDSGPLPDFLDDPSHEITRAFAEGRLRGDGTDAASVAAAATISPAVQDAEHIEAAAQGMPGRAAAPRGASVRGRRAAPATPEAAPDEPEADAAPQARPSSSRRPS